MRSPIAVTVLLFAAPVTAAAYVPPPPPPMVRVAPMVRVNPGVHTQTVKPVTQKSQIKTHARPKSLPVADASVAPSTSKKCADEQSRKDCVKK
jgi:hypothetical protein